MEIFGWNIALWIVLLLFIVVVYILHSLWQFQLFKRMGVPGPKPSWVIGTMYEEKKGFRNADMMRMEKYGRIWGTFDGPNPNLYVTDQDILRHLFVKKFSDFTDRRTFEGYNGDMEDALNIVKGDQWKNLRQLMSPTFSSGKLKRMTPLIVKASQSLVEHLSEAIQTDSQQDIKRCMGGYTMDVIASTAFGINVNSNKNPQDPFVDNASRFVANEITSWKVFVILMFPSMAKVLGKVFGVGFFPRDVQMFFRKVLVNTINERSSERSDYVDFLQLMMQAHIEDGEHRTGDKKGMTFKEILANALIFFFAGYETTAATLSFLSYELAHNQDIHDKLYKEIMENIGEEEPGYDNVSKLPYLEMCINETLRKYPPAFRVDRICTRDTELLDFKIPRGMIVTVPIYAIHHSPDLWEDPETYDPNRFLPENKATMTQFQFIPFGYGPRNCIGMRLALLEAKIAAVAVLKKFRFLVGDKTKLPENLDGKGLLSPNDLWLKVESR